MRPRRAIRLVPLAGWLVARRRVVAAHALAFLLFAGCARYRPLPLDHAAVDRALATPDPGAVRVAAASIRHPLLSPVHLDPDAGFSADEAAVFAVLVHPGLRGARDQRGIAAAQLLQAGLLPNPEISASVATPVSGDDTANGFGLGVGWEATALLSRGARRDAAAARAASVDLDIAWQEWQVAQAARRAVYQRLAAEERARIAGDIDRDLAGQAAAIRVQLEAGDRAVTDLASAEATSVDAHATALQAAQEADQQRLALGRAIGLPAGDAVRLRGGDLDRAWVLPDRDELVAGLEDRRLDLLALRRGYDSQEATVRAAILAQFPRISLGPQVGRDTAGVGTIGVGLTVAVPIFDRNQGAIAQERATRRQLFDEFVARLYDARADIASLHAGILAQREQLAAADAALPVLARRADEYRAAVEAHALEAAIADAARIALLQKRLERSRLRQQLAESRIAIELAAGRLLVETANEVADD